MAKDHNNKETKTGHNNNKIKGMKKKLNLNKKKLIRYLCSGYQKLLNQILMAIKTVQSVCLIFSLKMI